MAGRDGEKLQALLAEITVDDTGLARMLKDPAPPQQGKTHPDEVPETPAEPYVKPGELWLLGGAPAAVRR